MFHILNCYRYDFDYFAANSGNCSILPWKDFSLASRLFWSLLHFAKKYKETGVSGGKKPQWTGWLHFLNILVCWRKVKQTNKKSHLKFLQDWISKKRSCSSQTRLVSISFFSLPPFIFCFRCCMN